MITISNTSKIFILCPANLATGGPEALHQLCEALVNKGFMATICYTDYNKVKFESPIHPAYVKYNVPFVFEIENSIENYVLFPETFTPSLWEKKYSNVNKIVWWLSVTNFKITFENTKSHYESKFLYHLKKQFKEYPIPTFKKLQDTKIKHIAHSYFSVDFLRQNNISIVGQISDYMNEKFTTGESYIHKKENNIIYNAFKNGEFLDKIIQLTKDINWIPIKDMTPQQVSETMQKAKVYIDFGYHPGKERMPREACLMDCCMIIGKDGSAKYKEDMPIPDNFHFEKKEELITEISNKVRECINNYSTVIQMFQPYKKILLNEKEEFYNAIDTVFFKK